MTRELLENLQRLGLEPGRNGDGSVPDAGNGRQDSLTEADLARSHSIASSQRRIAAPARRGKSAAPYVLNDFYHAGKIVDLHGNAIRYCRKLGGFNVWDDKQWSRDETGCVWRWAIHAAWTEYRKAKDAEAASGDRFHSKKWALCASRRKNIEDALKQLQAHPDIVVGPETFDRDPWLFNVNNGTIDLQTGTLREHRREDMITKLSPIEFDPAAAPPERWIQFLHKVFDGNKSLIDFVQRACGYALTGMVSEQKLFFLHGRGSKGKSTFLATLMHVMGEHAMKLAPGLLFNSRRSAHPAGFADLKGSRVAVMPEIEFGRRLSEVAVKELTGVDPLTARFTRQEQFEFNPTHTVFMCGNHLPIVRGNEQSSWERIDLIPFNVSIPEEEQDKDLPARLRAEAPGILNWLVEGCLEWQKIGLSEPAEVTNATRSYRSDMDILGDFIDECCVLEPNLQATSADLIKAYDKWRLINGEPAVSARLLGLRLKERGFAQKRVGVERVRTWSGIGLKSEKVS